MCICLTGTEAGSITVSEENLGTIVTWHLGAMSLRWEQALTLTILIGAKWHGKFGHMTASYWTTGVTQCRQRHFMKVVEVKG